MEESQLYANCIAIALDVIRLYTIITGQDELQLQFSAVDMTQNIRSQKLIFNVLCDQIVTLHSHILLQSDVNELMNRLLFSAMELPLNTLQQVNNAMKTHCMFRGYLNNFLVTNNFKLEFMTLITRDENGNTVLDPVALQDLAPYKLRSSVSSTLNLGVLSEPNSENVIPTPQNVTVFDEDKQTFTSVLVLTTTQLQSLLERILANEPISDQEKAALFLTVDRLEHMFYWKEQL